TIAWEHGGPTALTNLAPLCKGHHTIKHHGGWQVEHIAGSGGALQWTSPSGRHYTVHPERRIPVFRTTPDAAPAPF
ncbi:MAG: HNH endonuclease signature motif containing protein, partial [Microbacterium sp.]